MTADIVQRLRDSATQARALDRSELLVEAAGEIERLRLTDAEREAVEWYAGYGAGDHATTLRCLLERMK